MEENKKQIKTALISVFNKDGLDEVIKLLDDKGIKLISTGGTAEFIRKMDIPVTEVEDVTGFPSIFGGRVKTIHPMIAGGILKIRGDSVHEAEAIKHNISEIDLVIVDLYPFEYTLASGASEAEIIEKIDIGGITLIREAAKNFNDVAIVPSMNQYAYLKEILSKSDFTSLEQRKYLAGCAFEVTSGYDFAIRSYFQGNSLRYGENSHQSAKFIGDISKSWNQLHGKEMSYNNFIDTESAIALVYDFADPAFAIIKHTNACGFAVDADITVAYKKAYEADPVSAFGGILASNRSITVGIANKIREDKLFVEVIIAPDYEDEALEILKQKKDIRILKWNNPQLPKSQIRTCLSGIIMQDRDAHIETNLDLTYTTSRKPTFEEEEDLLVANLIAKHIKSNAIAIVKNGQLLAMGCGQTSRIDALKQALVKAGNFKFDVHGAVMASEAFFPFPDCVEVAGIAGITAVIHPGGSKNDQASIDKCNDLKMAMVTTGYRHFKH
ncbi:bifunctional phosphoribosylaminoimidazolecarboxamide formyltransferase/IMP cyclohydrolase [Candidatus Nomurabacteria bacterium]|nr:bifunctional phosphoribosylaminoimidazolecarboxamide formyltransferase/IMP cyclohydrolase [Candidatus Nomurabacteria bacterium]